MMQIRRSQERGHANHGWLDSYHTFSFADYYDPKHMGFRDLRVINEDFIDQGMGFGTHGHRDMEIISVVVDGKLEHKDTMGNKKLILPGEVQTMSAGTGVQHSEYNPSNDQKTHLLQIWIMPTKNSVTPSYGQKSFADDLVQKKFVLAVSNDGRLGSLKINQDAQLYLGKFAAGDSWQQSLGPERHSWIHVIRGEMHVDQFKLQSGDALAVSQAESVKMTFAEKTEILFFDLN